MRTDYTNRQKQIIKQEVDSVVDLIAYEKLQSEILTKEKIKSRVYEAYSIAQNIYQRNTLTKNDTEIQQMIIDALRPIRFEQTSGYYFITRMDGIEILFANKPEMEGLSFLNVEDTQGQYVVKDMIEIVEQSSEGFYEYHWTKPDAEGNDFKKISFVKRFEPYDWFIGTGLYVVDVEDKIKADLLSTISRIRFGKEGYIFINRLNGDALVSNGKFFSGTKKLWEVFNDNPEKMKNIFEKEYIAALKPDGDYIYYSHIKLTNSNKESLKTSFIYGIPDLQWLVGAGVYLDDVETDIALMRTGLRHQTKLKVFYSILVVMGISVIIILFFNWLNCRLKNDFKLFLSFFNRAVYSQKKIDRGNVKFLELDLMAKNANKMLADRKQAEEALQESEEKYRHLIEKLDDIIWTVDLNLNTTYVSPSVIKNLGFTPKERMDQNPSDQMTQSSYQNIAELLIKELNQEKEPGVNPDRIDRIEVEYYHKNGSILWFENIISGLRDKNGILCGFHGVARDISDRKFAEKEKIKAQEIAGEQKKLALVGQVAGKMAHDFNNIWVLLWEMLSFH
jgi:PAS domain S-box-containing protein